MITDVSVAHTLLHKYHRALQVLADANTALAGVDEEELQRDWAIYVQRVTPEPTGTQRRRRIPTMERVHNAWNKLIGAVGIYDIITEAFRTQGNGMLLIGMNT